MISVQLMTGDMSIGADGTVTWIDGNKIYAFGHRFLSIGATAMPFARAEVLTLLPALNSSFKVSSARELMGTILQDRNTAVSGELGARAALVPVSVSVTRAGRKQDAYQMQMVDDGLLSPLLVQMAVFSAIDATERTVGASSFRIRGEIEFHGAAAPVRLDNMFAGDNGSAMQASLSAAVPLAYVLQSGFDALKLKKIDVAIESYDAKKQLQIDRVLASKRIARPGEDDRAHDRAGRRQWRRDRPQRALSRAGGRPTRNALLHRRRRRHHQRHRVPAVPEQRAQIARATALRGEQPAGEYQGLHPRLARRSRLPDRGRRLSGSAAFGGADPGRLARPCWAASRKPAIRNWLNWRSAAAIP